MRKERTLLGREGGEQYRSYIGGATNGDGGVHPGDKKGGGEGGRALREKRQLRATRRGRRIEIGRKEGGRKGKEGGIGNRHLEPRARALPTSLMGYRVV